MTGLIPEHESISVEFKSDRDRLSDRDLQTIIEEENRVGHSLPVDSLIALSLLRHERRVDTTGLAQ